MSKNQIEAIISKLVIIPICLQFHIDLQSLI